MAKMRRMQIPVVPFTNRMQRQVQMKYHSLFSLLTKLSMSWRPIIVPHLSVSTCVLSMPLLQFNTQPALVQQLVRRAEQL